MTKRKLTLKAAKAIASFSIANAIVAGILAMGISLLVYPDCGGRHVLAILVVATSAALGTGLGCAVIMWLCEVAL